MAKTRESARIRAGTGARRHHLIRSAAEHAAAARHAGFYVEATALIESILADRLEKRAQFAYEHATAERRAALEPVKSGFKTLGALYNALRNDDDPELRSLVAEVERWGKRRNEAVHEMAKLDSNEPRTWQQRLDAARDSTDQGISVLLEVDALDRFLHHHSADRPRASATCPNALAALGQPPCEWCPSARS